MLNSYLEKTSEPEVVAQICVMTGTGAGTAPTKNVGSGMTVSRVADGQYRITWSDHQGTFLGAVIQVEDSTPANVKGYTTVIDHDSYTAAGKAMDLSLYDSQAAPALVALATTSKLFVVVYFKRSSTSGA